jgi:1-acyl-sn-glycerol-3-phosphate acyltransferase
MKKIFARIRWLYAVIIIFSGMTLMIAIFHFVRKPYAQKIGSWFIRLLIFSPITVKGKADPQTQMFLINHQSDIDIGIMETITRQDLAWVAKKELFAIPFFGLVLRLPNDIAVERESKTSLITMLKDCRERLDAGRVITIFPEGTRSESGTMLPFKAGAKMVADKYALKVQPVVLIATSKYFSNKQRNFRPGTVTAIFLDAFVADRNDPQWLQNTQIAMQKVYDDEFSNHPRNR